MTRAEEKSIVYQLATHGPRVMGGGAILSEDDYKFWNINYDFKAGYEEAEKDLGWHSVDESLPPVDEEVIVLRNESNGITLPYPYNLTYGHLVADKTIFVEYNGWNVPGVKYWMPMPKIPKEDD